ncbi:TetR/AcrR family transcriptional regulator [Glycomyces algeriensis]|uniref:TetR family transcriptional regulator n=1 Tax=Glycomyces algeriensis TaxID=256037 RepID=A0A9W6G8V6_9ACTN|nr:TetR/AcrR family transcriptional regulator [Glycomyces algeriensis]MDA1365127.1 TetR/AcrR family transcriptional regulator [Glycomyces algeriensis]MDR7349811.1 AcrR family transcriptional regulator [Glycomyces algeriensis]GLI42521.1 TetR family transcriptional regulator [Glycomyces algeriensis]
MTDSTASRRRGDDLERAIFEAALEELAEVGYANLRMEAIAARAKAGKASLYKRWPDRAHLIRAAARHKATEVDTPFEPSGDVRADMERVMRRITENQGGPAGEALRGWVGELRASSEEAEEIRDAIEQPRIRVFAKIFEIGIANGTVRPEALHPRIVNLAPSLLTQHFLMKGRPATEAVIGEILDQIVMPLITAGR